MFLSVVVRGELGKFVLRKKHSICATHKRGGGAPATAGFGTTMGRVV